MKIEEFGAYTVIALTLFMLISLPGIFFSVPNLNEPTPINQPEFDGSQDVNIPDTRVSNIFLVLMRIVLIILIVFALYKIIPFFRSTVLKSKPQKISEKESEIKLQDARIAAYEILRKALINEKYTNGFIEAYQRLDTDLEYFREIYRPKFWTPKEYAYSVREPVFRPAVYEFVSIFYDIRYGLRQAIRENVEKFITMLDYLFIKDVPEEVKLLMRSAYKEKVKVQDISIPRKGDLTKPGGKR